jgi:hypothetical protein
LEVRAIGFPSPQVSHLNLWNIMVFRTNAIFSVFLVFQWNFNSNRK